MIVDLDRKWMSRAVCAGMPSDVFYNEHHPNAIYKGRPTARVRAHWERAKLVCAKCPVIKECARDGLGERDGIWGGLDPAQRMELRRKHNVNVRALTGPVKQEYASLVNELHINRHMPYQDVARIIGISIETAQYLYDWYLDWVNEQPPQGEPEPVAPEQSAIASMKQPPWPTQPPQDGDGWVRWGGVIIPAWYVGETLDGDWFLMSAFTNREHSRAWFKKRDVSITGTVAANIRIKSPGSGRVYGTALSSKGRRGTAG